MYIIIALLSVILIWMLLRKNERNMQARRIRELYRTILDETQTAVVAHDIKTGEIFYANEPLRRIYGVVGDLENLSPASMLWKERGKKHQDLDYEALRNGACNEEIEYHPSGRIYQVKGKIIDWAGREAYLEYLFDITDSKRFSEQLQLEHEELQQKYQEEMLYRDKSVSNDIIASSRINLSQGYIEEMRVGKRDGYEKKYHYASDLISRIVAFSNEVWMTEQQNRNMSTQVMLQRYMQGERNFSEEYMAELKDGRHVWIKTEAKLVQRPETAEIIAFCYSKDITQEKVLTNILECIMSFDYDEIFTVDSLNGQIALVARGRYAMDEELEGISYDQEVEKLLSRIPVKKDAMRIREVLSMEKILEELEKQSVYITEVAMLSKSGKTRLKQLRFTYLNKTMGTVLFTITDIDDMVKAEKQKQEELEEALQTAEEANNAKMRFLASMSHEIRTPMNVIIGLASMIKEEAQNSSRVLENANHLEATSKYLLSLLNDVLDMAKIEKGNMQLNKNEFSVIQFWETVNTLASSQAKKANVAYVFEREQGNFEVFIGDVVRLQQILINLINNAIKFTPAGGRVCVKARQKKVVNARANVEIQVIDTGIGISKEFLPKIFEVFTQEHDATTSAYGGSGLGLAIAKSFARMMGGDISVTSEEGKGTTFTVDIWLDLAKEANPTQKIALEKKEGAYFAGKKILLVEDHPLNTMVAKRLLEKQGIEVVHAENGKIALDYFTESGPNEYDAILMDVRMPVMDGITATEHIRKLSRADAKSVPIIAMTANAFDEDKKYTKEAGMNAHLAKPIEPRVLYETLAQLLQT